ncbi:hypothetical protein Q0M94_08960 [Deinococcus radiomollis]|uniref:hypothetical protein n=1 Tax=Deinococcus radiomollis TaxID=468916 RepID=UPI00389189DC
MSSRRASPTSPAATQTYQAGCDRTWTLPSRESDLAYTEQAFPECPACPHRVEPEGASPFCTLRPMNTPHPFAGLAGLLDGLEE